MDARLKQIEATRSNLEQELEWFRRHLIERHAAERASPPLPPPTTFHFPPCSLDPQSVNKVRLGALCAFLH